MITRVFSIIALTIACALLCCCGGNTSSASVDGEIGVDSVLIEHNIYEVSLNDTTISYEVQIKYYTLKNAPVALKDSVDKDTYNWIASFFMGPPALDISLDSLIMKGYYSLLEEVKEMPEDCVSCRQRSNTITPSGFYANDEIISISYSWSEYSGGAHGMYGEMCFVYDKETGKLLTYDDLVKDEEALLVYAEKKFREQNNIGEKESLEEDWFFPNGKFYLNSNFALSEQGVTFYYTPYEIAPYAIGMIELFLPADDIEGFVNYLN